MSQETYKQHQYAYQQYQSNSVYTAAPAELTLMLYNGAIKFCNQGIEAITNKRIENANRAIIKAQDIIVELRATLDESYPIALEFDRMYAFIIRLLKEANVAKDGERLIQARDLIKELRDLWKEVMAKGR